MAERPLLRHADWRWLLPPPRNRAFDHLVLWGGSEALAELLLSDGIAKRISCDDPGPGAADAVVLLHGSGTYPRLDRAVSMLGPDGVLYAEIDRRTSDGPLRRSPARLHAALNRMGMSVTGMYWIQPSFRTRQTYIPIDRTGPLDWYLRTSAASSSRLAWMRTMTQRALLPFRRSAAVRLIRRYAVTAVAGPTATRPQLSHLVREALPRELRAEPLHAVVVTNGADDLDRIVVLPFSDTGSRPLAVVKFPRLPDRNFLVEAEHQALDSLQPLLDDATRDALPRSFGLSRWGELSVGAESYVEGRSLAARSRSPMRSVRRKTQDFRLAAEWLTAFHLQAQAAQRSWAEADWDEHVRQPLHAYCEAYGRTPAEARLFSAVEAQRSVLLGTRLPLVWQHYAFAPWNVLRDGDRLRVFDWEGAALGLPLLDLWYFAVKWNEDVANARSESARLLAFRTLIGECSRPNTVPAHVERAVRTYVDHLGMHPAYRSIALVLLVVTRAISALERSGPAGGPRDRAANPRAAYVEEVANASGNLFPIDGTDV
jgi:hypothetical protein